MKRVSLFLLCITYLQLYSQTTNQEIVTNNTVIELYKAGLGKTVIISKINTSVCQFDLSTEKLIELKKSGISDEIIDAMLAYKSGNNNSNISPNNQQTQNAVTKGDLPSGIYYCKGSPCELVELEPSVYSQAKTGSGLLTAITYGLAKTKNKATLSGDKANLQIEDSLPAFYFYFDKSQSGNLSGSQQMGWFSAATSPNEFLLVKFTLSSDKKSREVVTGSWNSYEGMTSGIDNAQKISFKHEKVSQGVYKVYLEKAIPKGEYCFMYAGGTTAYGSPLQKVFDFGIK